jgi:hypothetical protein
MLLDSQRSVLQVYSIVSKVKTLLSIRRLSTTSYALRPESLSENPQN